MISSLVRACLLFDVIADAEALRICDGCPGSLVEAMCDFQMSDIQVSPLFWRRVLAAADGLRRPLKAINIENTL